MVLPVKFLLTLLLTLTSLVFQTQSVSAAITSGVKNESAPPPSLTAGSCAGTGYCKDIGVCVNQERAGVANPKCGTACAIDGQGFGDAWTKYNFDGCYLTEPDTEGNQECISYYPPSTEKVYSIGDKCTSGGPYLNPGYCESAFGGPIYKTCCSSDGNALSPFQCVAFDADGAGDPEGRCPGGYQREVFCGQPGEPECGQPSCGPVSN